jgi:hypothetical protein
MVAYFEFYRVFNKSPCEAPYLGTSFTNAISWFEAGPQDIFLNIYIYARKDRPKVVLES